MGRDEAETATLVLVLDALNFCFWAMPGSTVPRWSVEYLGEVYDGYLALAVALRRAVERGVPLADPDYLAGLDLDQVRSLLAPLPGTQEIPLIEARLANLQEVGRAVRDRWQGSFARAILDAGGSASSLIDEVLEALPSFRDTAFYRGQEVRFYKRAQILIADLHGALAGSGPGRFDDLDKVTAFADYKVPQILRQFRILKYHPDLAETIRRYDLVPSGDEREVEIRAATVWAVELLRRALDERGRALRAFEIDWLLWNAAQSLPTDSEPYHRTLTIYY
ncbi:MAG: queuosine salvage family protein [Thermomicrobiales bacterium]